MQYQSKYCAIATAFTAIRFVTKSVPSKQSLSHICLQWMYVFSMEVESSFIMLLYFLKQLPTSAYVDKSCSPDKLSYNIFLSWYESSLTVSHWLQWRVLLCRVTRLPSWWPPYPYKAAAPARCPSPAAKFTRKPRKQQIINHVINEGFN